MPLLDEVAAVIVVVDGDVAWFPEVKEEEEGDADARVEVEVALLAVAVVLLVAAVALMPLTLLALVVVVLTPAVAAVLPPNPLSDGGTSSKFFGTGG